MAARHPLRILLAEDNVVNQKLAMRLLQQMGYRADLASNGIEAVESVARQTYDVVLMDVQMPEMDGLEAAKEITSRWSANERPRIVAMTANAMQGDREMCLAAGMDDYLTKPIRIERLVEALNVVAARGNTEDGHAADRRPGVGRAARAGHRSSDRRAQAQSSRGRRSHDAPRSALGELHRRRRSRSRVRGREGDEGVRNARRRPRAPGTGTVPHGCGLVAAGRVACRAVERTGGIEGRKKERPSQREAEGSLRLAQVQALGRIDMNAGLVNAARAASLFESLGDTANHGRALHARSVAFSNLGQSGPTRQAAAEALVLARRSGDLLGEGNALNLLGFTETDLATQLRLWNQALEAFKSAAYVLSQSTGEG
jgi:CheY-like chemotaxis protein